MGQTVGALRFLETSSMTGHNISKIFDWCVLTRLYCRFTPIHSLMPSTSYINQPLRGIETWFHQL
jgi:hypothetical protein